VEMDSGGHFHDILIEFGHHVVEINPYATLVGVITLVVGVAYKRDIDDVRESPALDVIQLLHDRGADVHWIDSNVPSLRDFDFATKVDALDEDFDVAVITTVHSDFDHTKLLERCSRVVDARNALRGVDSEKILRL